HSRSRLRGTRRTEPPDIRRAHLVVRRNGQRGGGHNRQLCPRRGFDLCRRHHDMVAQRVVDALMSLAGLLIALAIMAVVTPSLNTVVLAIVIGMIAPVIRKVRSQVLSLKELDYVTAAQAIGAPPWRIIFRHIVPNCFATYLVLATYYLGFAIIIESSLSFLGVGTPPDQPSWGGMLVRAASAHVKSGPWLAIFPGLAIFVVVMGFNLLGDALRDVFD
ncbi:Putative peptide transport system permease protein BMEII0207/BMEII0208, partial [Geodia barretti]